MKLKKFTKNKKQKRIVIGSIVGILLLIGGITLYRTFALYKVETSFDVLKGTVPDFSSGDVTLAFTVNDKKESGVPFPNKNEGFKVDGVTCDEGITADWDNNTWSLTNIKNSNSQSKIKCTINFKRYEEQLLNGSYPVLKEGLVPVNIDNSGKVTKADITQNWYEYGQKKWANAVILADGVEEPETGAPIEEKDIESYFVWIPKYRYKLFDDKLGRYSEVESGDYKDKGPNTPIEIEFGIENTKDDKEHNECATPNKSGEDGNCKVNDWMTHPAFTAFENSKGFWVGKFETGYNGANENTFTETTTTTTCKVDVNTKDVSKIIIKPNSYSWRCIDIANSYDNSYNYQRNLDSHTMKNTEWGAIAYLTQSLYGRCSNSENETACTEVIQNKNTNYKTGYVNTEQVWPNSKGASTTGNNTGIFDMNGGAWEQMINVMESVNSETLVGSQKLENKRYYDFYNYSDSYTHWEKRILGDATGELGPFKVSGSYKINSYFGDSGIFVSFNNPIFMRGGACVDDDGVAGVFAFSIGNGSGNIYHTFRIVLAP